MAGNKALKKFAKSKIPKKGSGKVTKTVKVYKEPNTHSEVIDTIEDGKEIFWISKSICDEREWVRCDDKLKFGYIIGHEKDGNCNLEKNSIFEKEDKIIQEIFKEKFDENSLTQKEKDIANECFKEVLSEIEDSSPFEIQKSSFENKSTEEEDAFQDSIEDIFKNTDEKTEKIFGDKIIYDELTDININDINLNVEEQNKLNNQLINDQFNTYYDILYKILEEKDNNEAQTLDNSFLYLSNLIQDEKTKKEYEININNIKKQNLSKEEMIIQAFSIHPGLNICEEKNKYNISDSNKNIYFKFSELEDSKKCFEYNQKTGEIKFIKEKELKDGYKDYIKKISLSIIEKTIESSLKKILKIPINFGIIKAAVEDWKDGKLFGKNCCNEIASEGLSKVGALTGGIIGKTITRLYPPIGMIYGAAICGKLLKFGLKKYLPYKYKDTCGSFLYEQLNILKKCLKEQIKLETENYKYHDMIEY